MPKCPKCQDYVSYVKASYDGEERREYSNVVITNDATKSASDAFQNASCPKCGEVLFRDKQEMLGFLGRN